MYYSAGEWLASQEPGEEANQSGRDMREEGDQSGAPLQTLLKRERADGFNITISKPDENHRVR